MASRDSMKYWRLIRAWAKAKYGLTVPMLDMLFFLNSEKLFKWQDFQEYSEIFTWDKTMFNRLRQEGWIDYYRKSDSRKLANIYQLTLKAKRALNNIYEKMDNTEFSEEPRTNPFFKKDIPFSKKVVRNYMKKINRAIQQGRCHEVE